MAYDIIGELVAEVQQMCREDQYSPKSIRLTYDQTRKFYACRSQWGNRVQIRCIEGQLVKLDLPSFPLPVRTHTLEEYKIEGVRILPAFDYHGIINFFLSRCGMNLIPAGTRA